MRVAVIGLGKMGHAIASRLVAAGDDVTVWNRSAGKAADLVAAGAREAATVADAVGGAEIVVASLADDAAVRAVVLGEAGVSGALGGDAVYVDASTISPGTAAAVAAELEGRSLSSPILGAPQAVAAGRANYLVSGPRPVFEKAHPVYERLVDEPASQVRYLGEEVGSALELKLLANTLLLTGVAALAEVIAVARRTSLAEETVRQFLEASPLVAPALHNRLEAMLTGEHSGWFTTLLGAKDVRLAEEMASGLGLEVPVASAVRQRYEEAARAGYGDADLTAVVELSGGGGPGTARLSTPAAR